MVQPLSPSSTASPVNPRRRALLVFALYFGLSAVFLYDVVFTGRAYVLRDILTFFHPWQTAVREAVQSGHLPLWNPGTYCGIPLLANLQCGFYYPLNWLYWFLPFDQALTLGMMLHLTVAGFLMRSFLRRARLSERGAFLGGALFAFGSWSLSYLEFPMKIGSVVWIPLVWSGIWESIRRGRGRGLVWTASGVALSVLAGYPQLALFGFLSATILAVCLILGMWSDESLDGSARLHRLGAWPAGLMIGGILTAAQILPSIEMARLSSKVAPYEATVALSRSLPPQSLLGLVDPFFRGFPGGTRFWGGEIGEYSFGAFYIGAMALVLVAASGPTFVGSRRQRPIRRDGPGSDHDSPVVPRALPYFLLTGLVIGVVLAIGRHTPVYPFLHEHVPGFGRIRWPATAGALIAMHLAPLAGIGLETALRRRARLDWACIGIAAIGLALIGVWMLARGPLAEAFRSLQTGGIAPFQQAAYESTRSAWLATLVVRGCVVLAAGGVGLLLGTVRTRVAPVWITLLLVDLFLVGRSLGMPTARGFYDRVPERAAELDQDLAGKRIYTPRSVDQLGNLLYGSDNLMAYEWAKGMMLCNANIPLGISQVQGCDPLSPRRHEAFVQAFDAPSTPHPIRERIFDLWDAAALVSTDVRPNEIPTLADADRGPDLNRHEPRLGRATLFSRWETHEDGRSLLGRLLSPNHDPRSKALLEVGPGGQAPRPPGYADPGPGQKVLCEYGPNRIRSAWQSGDGGILRVLESWAPGWTAGGILRVLESWAPGWTAIVNGRAAPIYRADFLFMAVAVPPGSCEVRFDYRPESVSRGLLASVSGLLALVLIGVSDRRKSREGDRE